MELPQTPGFESSPAPGPAGPYPDDFHDDAVPPVPADWPAQDGCSSDPELGKLIGTWDGQVEDFYLKPIVHLHIVITGASSGGLCGTVTWGTLPSPPPADDPDAIYPSTDYWRPWGADGLEQNMPPIEGFSYTIVEGSVRLPDVTIGVGLTEPWRSWCAIQTPIAVDDGYACIEQPRGEHSILKQSSGGPDAPCTVEGDAGVVTYNAFKCGLCYGLVGPLCACDSAACQVVATPVPIVTLQMSDDGRLLTGYNPTVGATNPPAWDGSIYLEHLD